MKKASLILIFTIFLAACIPFGQPVSQQVSEAYIQTAVASTLMAERALAAGAALSISATPGSTTPSPATPEGTTTLEAPKTGQPLDPGATPEDPWMLQSWCADHIGCAIYDISNRTDSWLQVLLIEAETGVTRFYSIQSKGTGRITLIPGYYTVTYTWWCDGKEKSLTENKGIGSYIDMFKCPQGFYQRVDK